MIAAITGFRIVGLHGRRDVSIAIENNRVVLVGVNGLGKTTIINVLYCLLTRQWLKLVEYKFDAIAIDVGGKTLSITRTQLESPVQSSRIRARLARFSPRFAATLKINPSLATDILTAPDDPRFLRAMADELQVPYSLVRDIRHMLDDEPVQQELFSSAEEIKALEENLGTLVPGQVLYLPTYRRIERDLEKLFPGLDEQVQRQRANRSLRQSAYLEFVEFGMTDVEQRFAELLAGLKERARSELNGLAASYLGEVIRGEADTFDTTLISSLDDDTIARILNRVEERNILDVPDRHRLRAVISKLKTASNVTPQETYVGHFFSKLATIHKSLLGAEGAIESFVQVCNGYLVGKRIVFDDRKYAIAVLQEPGDAAIELRHLSSGEKQIVSLFTHIYLGAASEFMVLIDEPELSLSVPWQQQLLPDILRSKKCGFLAAVTHSPFIYENELRDSATDLQQCIVDR
jgi:predicted ATP-dependent endonuclease of OLD family